MSDNSPSGFFEELKRRNVLRVGLAYLVGAWVLIQVADTVFPYMGLSDEIIALVIGILAIGFNPAVILAWVFELTPDGVMRDDKSSDSKPDRQALRGLDYALIAILFVVTGLYGYEKIGRPVELASIEVISSSSPSIAVLPFENRSANEDDIYFVDGIHDDILTSLAKIDSMKVISRTSMAQFRDTDKSIKEIGSELGVAAILEGGVQRSGDSIRINVQLIDARSDGHVWAETYNRQLTANNIFAIQSEIANTIAAAMQTALSPQDQVQIASVPTESLDAYDAYIRGSQLLARRTGASVEGALASFQEAISLDSEFALAYVGLADSYILLPDYTNKTRAETLAPAFAAANTAMELDPNLGEAYTSLAMIYNEHRLVPEPLFTRRDPEPLFRRAIELSPNYVTAFQWYGEFLADSGRADEGIRQLRTAIEIDPLSPILNYILADLLMVVGQFAQSEALNLKAIDIDPGFSRAYQGLARFYQTQGRLADAVNFAEKAIVLNPTNATNPALLSMIYNAMGDAEEAENWLNEASRIEPDRQTTRMAAIELARLRRDELALAREIEESSALGFNGGLFFVANKDQILSEGKIDDAIRLLSEPLPGLLSDPELTIVRENVWLATNLAGVLQRVDRHAEANSLLNRSLNFVNEYGQDPTPDQIVFIASIHSLMGDKPLAIAALRQAVDDGWRYNWYYELELNPNFDSMRDEPEFQAILDEFRADMAAQLAIVQARKDSVL
jgi:TolB-like protein/Tfp pilus assembly protein PilF